MIMGTRDRKADQQVAFLKEGIVLMIRLWSPRKIPIRSDLYKIAIRWYN